MCNVAIENGIILTLVKYSDLKFVAFHQHAVVSVTFSSLLLLFENVVGYDWGFNLRVCCVVVENVIY